MATTKAEDVEVTEPESASAVQREGAGGRCAACCRSFVAFLFSTVGLTILLAGYCIAGGFIFMALEATHEGRDERRGYATGPVRRLDSVDVLWNETAEERERIAERLWQVTVEMNVFHRDNWTNAADAILRNYTASVYGYVNASSWEAAAAGGETKGELSEDMERHWSYAGSLLYAITVITKIGYGDITPKTSWGRIVTIIYAIVGIPLTLLTVTNLGAFMATAFRYVYRNVCCAVCCICCRRAAASPRNVEESGTAKTNASTSRADEVESSCWSAARRALIITDDIRAVRVPLVLSVSLIGAYLAVGALLFTLWERDWDYLVGFYFCFVTLSTIGFGDFVPGASLETASEAKLVICALYLLVGLALIAMCFDLIQEEVRGYCAAIGRRLRLVAQE